MITTSKLFHFSEIALKTLCTTLAGLQLVVQDGLQVTFLPSMVWLLKNGTVKTVHGQVFH